MRTRGDLPPQGDLGRSLTLLIPHSALHIGYVRHAMREGRQSGRIAPIAPGYLPCSTPV
jgi:hypothetical protein